MDLYSVFTFWVSSLLHRKKFRRLLFFHKHNTRLSGYRQVSTIHTFVPNAFFFSRESLPPSHLSSYSRKFFSFVPAFQGEKADVAGRGGLYSMVNRLEKKSCPGISNGFRACSAYDLASDLPVTSSFHVSLLDGKK